MTLPVEVAEVPAMSLTAYVAELSSPAAVQRQRALAAAYDAACAALLGPNDVNPPGANSPGTSTSPWTSCRSTER